jgi:hypothetical protein
MVVKIKIGRRIHRNNNKRWFAKQINNMKNVISIQQYMWRTIEYGLKLSTTKMDKHIKKLNNIGDYSFNYQKKKYIEEESLNYNIEWIEINIKGTEEIEKDEYEASMRFFSKLENLPVFKKNKENIELDEELSREYKGKLYGKKAKKVIKKGFDKAKDMTISKSLNDIGIITLVEKEENKENEIIQK